MEAAELARRTVEAASAKKVQYWMVTDIRLWRSLCHLQRSDH